MKCTERVLYVRKNKEKNFKLKFRLFLKFLIASSDVAFKWNVDINKKRVRHWNLQVFSVETM